MAVQLAALGVGGPAAAPVLSFSDNFNRSDRALNGDNGWSWGIGSTGFDIVSNELQIGSTAGDNLQVNSAISTASGYVEADIKLQAADGTVGLVFRYQDANNFYLIDCNIAAPANVRADFYKRQGGTYTLITSFSPGSVYLNNTYGTFRIAFSGTSYPLYFNGVLQTTFTDSTFTAAGLGGLRNGGGSTATRTVDNFVISQ